MFRLRDLSVSKQSENDGLKKENESLEQKLKSLTKEHDNAKADVANMQATIADLKEQVRRISILVMLTTRNVFNIEISG